MTIRPLRSSDAGALRGLCLAKTPLRKRSEVERLLIGLIYCDYYLDYELAHSFAALAQGELAGAVLCAPDYAAYARRVQTKLLPKCRGYGLSALASAKRVSLLHQGVAGQYPAHCQLFLADGNAAGALLEAAQAHLDALGCRGVCAFPDKREKELRQGFAAQGFALIAKKSAALIYGKELFM
ncbi:MAG: hypothetical protein LBQ33_03835 [Oscillospiraceae bacterium]|jgi:hypothetical protein|nr:hypothetical protein [Oscillospiraceae bacterium]